MERPIILKVLSPEGALFEGPVEAVFLPGSAGRFEILPGHAPIITTLEKGRILWRSEGVETSLDLKSGALMLKDNVVTVCVEPEK